MARGTRNVNTNDSGALAMYTVYIWLVSPVRSLSGLYFVSNRGAVREISDVNISRVLLSPDGRPIVYTRAVARDHNEHLWVVGLDGRDGRELYAPLKELPLIGCGDRSGQPLLVDQFDQQGHDR
jgi:hypothetical protein